MYQSGAHRDLHRAETPDLIDKTGVYADYLYLIRLAEPRRWYVSYKIRVREGETVHYGPAPRTQAQSLSHACHAPPVSQRHGLARHGRERTIDMPGAAFRTSILRAGIRGRQNIQRRKRVLRQNLRKHADADTNRTADRSTD